MNQDSNGGPQVGHVPYRNSIMTMVLKDSLGGNTRTAMIATLATEIKQLDESISTCRFAQRVARVKNKVRHLQKADLILNLTSCVSACCSPTYSLQLPKSSCDLCT